MSIYTDIREQADIEITNKRMAVVTFEQLGNVDPATGSVSVMHSIADVPIIGANFTTLERDISVVQTQDFKIFAPAKRFSTEPDDSWQVRLSDDVFEIRFVAKHPPAGVTAVYEFQVGK